MSRVFKPSTRLKPVSRGKNAVREDAVKRSEPRTPELEIPRLLGAGVGAGSLNLPFELNICPECGWRLVEHNGLLVCERSRYTPEARESEAAARRLSSLKGAPRHAVTPPVQGSSTPIPWRWCSVQLAPSLGARAARGPVSRNRPDPRKRGWARMDRVPRKGRGMEEVERKRDSYKGSGAAGRSPRAKRSRRKRTENNVKRNKAKSKKKRNVTDKNGSDQEIIPLNAWARLLLELCGDPCGSGGSGAQAVCVVRVDTLRLLTTPELDDFLRRVGDATARLINMENFRRRKQFFEAGKIDYSWVSAWSRRFTDYFEIYKLLGSANFHEACRLIGDQWRSFVGLLRAAKEGRLEPWQRVHPPGYRKDRDGQRVPIVVVRFDSYRIDLERRVLRLGY